MDVEEEVGDEVGGDREDGMQMLMNMVSKQSNKETANLFRSSPQHRHICKQARGSRPGSPYKELVDKSLNLSGSPENG